MQTLTVRARRPLAGLAAMLVTTLALGVTSAWAQSAGDYRSIASGNWNAIATWQRYDGTTWVAATTTPTNTDGAITIRAPHLVTITASVSIDQTTIESSAQVVVGSAQTLTLASTTPGTDLTINGTLLNQGTWMASGSWNPNTTWTVGSGGTYIHNTSAGGISTPLDRATLDASSRFVYRGSSTVNAPVSLTNRTYGYLSFESTSGAWTPSVTGTGTLTVNGDFSIGSGVALSIPLTGVMTFARNFTINGTLTNGTGTQIYTFTGSGASINGAGAINFETLNINPGATILLNAPVTILPTFVGTVASNATLVNGSTLTNSGTLTVNGTLITSGAITTASGQVGIYGTFQISPGGSISAPPGYGSSSQLIYATGGVYNVGVEWTGSGAGAGGARAAGLGQPQNVTIQGTTLTLDASPRAVPGNLTIGSGGLALTAGGDLAVAGNWSRSSGATFAHNNVGVWFIGSGTQSLAGPSTGEIFGYLILKGSNLLTLGSPVSVTGATGDALQFYSNSSLDLGSYPLTISGNGTSSGAIKVDGTAHQIVSSLGTGVMMFNAATTVNPTNGGSLVLGTSVLAGLTKGVNLVATTILGALELDGGGFVNTNSPTYGSSSTLIYNNPAGFNVGLEWTGSGAGAGGGRAAGAGQPQNVIVQTGSGTALTLDANPRALPGNLNITLGGLRLTPGGDLTVGGHWSRAAGTTFAHNDVGVWFMGSGTQTITGPDPETFGYLILEHTGTLRLGSNVSVVGAAGDALQMLSSGSVDLNGKTLFMAGGGALRVDGGSRTIDGPGGGTVFFSAKAIVHPTNGGSLTLGSTVTAELTNGVVFSATTLNGTLQLDGGGFVNLTPPTYGGASTLVYNSAAGYAVAAEWAGGGSPGLGVPQHVTVKTGTVATPASARTVPGTLTFTGGGMSLGADLTINGSLALGASVIATGGNRVTLGTGVTTTRSTGYVNGTLEKTIASGAAAPTFEIGDASTYTPVAIQFGNVSNSTGLLSARTTGSAGPPPAGSNLSPSLYVNRSWTLDNNGVAFDSYSATLNFASGDLVGGADPNHLIAAKNTSGTWSNPTIGTRGTTSTQVTGLTQLSEFWFGEHSPWTITATFGTGGSISPSGAVTVNDGADQTFIISPNPQYLIQSVTVDGGSVGSPTSYTFTSVHASHTIAATFVYAPVTNVSTGLIYPTIQTAIDAAQTLDGHLLHIAAGVYEEQVVVTKALTLDGDGCAATVIRCPMTLTQSYTPTTTTYKPIVWVNGKTVTIQNLTVDGMGRGNLNARFIGISYWNSGGKVANVCVVNVEDTPFGSASGGYALYAHNNTGGPFALECDQVTATGFQHYGMVLAGPGLAVDVHDCTVTGAGYTAVATQYGIYLSGAAGSIARCKVSDCAYTGPSFTVSGIIAVNAPTPVNISEMTAPNGIFGCEFGVWLRNSSGTVDGVQFSGHQSDGGVYVDNTTTGTVAQPANGHAPKIPDLLDDGQQPPKGRLATLTTYTVNVTHCCLTGSSGGNSDSYVGVWGESDYGGIAITATYNTITNYQVGCQIYGSAATLTAHFNAIAGNTNMGYFNGCNSDESICSPAQDATRNWWGAADGPGGLGPGSGDRIARYALAGEVAFSPWLHSGANGSTGCDFVPPSYTIASSAGPHGGIDPIGTLTAYSGDDVNYTITPAPCYSVQDVVVDAGHLGPLTSYTFTNVQANHTISATFVVRTYTITATAGAGGSITPSGAASVACGADQTFTIVAASCHTIADVKVDDVSKGAISSYTFTSVSAHHTIDATFVASQTPPPLPATGVTATQVRQGNGTGGTTRVEIEFTPPTDGSHLEVYRAAYGNYPEYDDGTSPGSVPPAPPSDRWVATGLTASPAHDAPPARDFCYYAVRSFDDCGHEAWSQVTTGTLDYHLGDVHDGDTDCAGNNRVYTEDVSFLGAHYGEWLHDPPQAGEAPCLDVGPTSTDLVDGRPLTDNRIEFEDLIVFSINYQSAGVPSLGSRVDPARVAAESRLGVEVGARAPVGGTFEVALRLESAGDVKAVSVELSYDAAVVEPVGVAGGELLSRQAAPAQALSAKPGVIDATVFGRDLAFTGSGELARVTFQVKSAGEPGIALGTVRARDARNRPLTLGRIVTVQPPKADRPDAVELSASWPNPFTNATTVMFGLPRAADVTLNVLDLQGRHVATLLHGAAAAGWIRARWDGSNTSGVKMSPGAYVIRLAVEGRVITKRVLLVR